MSDDFYLISADGWRAATSRVLEKKKTKDGKVKETDKGWVCDLVPKELIVAKYFSNEQSELNKINSDAESIVSQKTEMEEEHSNEDGFLSENNLDKINKAGASARLKELEKDKDAKDEIEILKKYIGLCDQESDLRKKAKELEAKIDRLAYEQYPKLKENDVKELVVDHKWMASLEKDIQGELDRISQSLASRIEELAERYESSLPVLIKEVSKFESKVSKHLEKMGFTNVG